MADLIELTGLSPLLQEAGVADFPGEDFEQVYATLLGDPEMEPVARRIERRIREYFQGLVLPPSATIYDKLVLSLRDKDYIATFNWDPLLAQAYQRNRGVGPLPRLLFLHGNVAVGACPEHKQKGFLEHACPDCARPLPPVPLLYPVTTKNYEDNPFIASEWREFRHAVSEAYILTIFGYAAPTSDVAARELMLAAWEANQTRELAEIDIVDIKERDALMRTWQPFFVRSHFGISSDLTWLFRHPRRSCDHFAMATLQQRPCAETPLPNTNQLEELQAWIAPLVAEERDLRESGTAFRC